jgi:hypothetical protein
MTLPGLVAANNLSDVVDREKVWDNLGLNIEYPGKDLFFNQVSLLLHGDGANGSITIVDNSPTPKTVTAFGNAQVSTAQSKFGGASIAFDGNGDYLTVPNNSQFQIGNGSFTVEFFLRLVANSTPSFGQSLVSVRNTGGSANGWSVHHYLGQLVGVIAGQSSGLQGSMALNTWQHIALTYDGANGRLFLDGTLLATFAATPGDNTNPLVVCNEPLFDNNRSSNCFIDDLRITKGVARYIANFSPPTESFPDSP